MNLLQAYACRVFQLRNDPLVIRHNNRTSPLSRISPLVYQQVFFFLLQATLFFNPSGNLPFRESNPSISFYFFLGVAPSSKSKIIEDVVRYFAWRQLFWSFLIMVDTYFALDNHYPHRVIQKLTNSDQSHEEPDGWTSFFGGYMAIPAISWMYTENHI
jgi:hypothetical protein